MWCVLSKINLIRFDFTVDAQFITLSSAGRCLRPHIARVRLQQLVLCLSVMCRYLGRVGGRRRARTDRRHSSTLCCHRISQTVRNTLYASSSKQVATHTHTHTHTFNGPFSGTARVSRYQKVKPIWILLKQETVSGSGISWAICKSASRSRQITMPAPHHSVFLQAEHSSCRPTNSVKALKATVATVIRHEIASAPVCMDPWFVARFNLSLSTQSAKRHLDRFVRFRTRSTQPCIPPGSLNRVPASAGVRAGMSPLPGGR